LGVCLAVLWWSGFVIPAPAQAGCDKPGRVIQETVLYDQPAQFRTSGGWIYGRNLGTVKKGEAIWVCDERNVGFAFSSQRWVQIGYYKTNSWAYGWVKAEDVNLGTAWSPAERGPGFFFLSTAHAQEPDVATTRSSGPPSPPPSDKPAPMLDFGLTTLDGYAFFAMVIGMSAKVVVGFLSNWGKAKVGQELRTALIALVFSPIVYLSLVKVADFNITSNREFLVLMLLAFQNGFFWQSIPTIGATPGSSGSS